MNFLVIEDDMDVFEVVQFCLNTRWGDATVTHAPLGELGIQMVRDKEPDMVILDIGLPDIDGFQVCTRIRDFSDVPIVMLTVRDTPDDIVWGLERGADDYITKPFRPVELVSRVNAILRRIQMTQLRDVEIAFRQGNVVINFRYGEVFANSEPIRLHPTESQVFYHLLRNAGGVVASQTLLEDVWGEEYRDRPYFLTASIVRLRDSLQRHAPTQGLMLMEQPGGYFLATAEGGAN